MDNKYDVIVIGGGPGGYTAALYAARANLSVLVVEKFSPGGQMATTDIVENYPGFVDGINGFELGMQMKQGAERFGVKSKMKEVKSVNLVSNPKIVQTAKDTFEAKTVILATGAFPRELGLPNEGDLRGRGVSYCATCDGEFFTGKELLVIGGGFASAEESMFLTRYAKKVTILVRKDSFSCAKSIVEELVENKISTSICPNKL